MRRCQRLWIALALPFLTACERSEPVPMGQQGEPMFRVDSSAAGPLSFEELQLNFTALPEPISERQRRCVRHAIERRSQELGDPAAYQPEDHDYHGGQTSNAQWQSFDNNMQRALLAQVVVTYAFFDCD
ncbi:MAG: hypothetical protein ACFHXK_20450 [bacterium]